MDTKTPELLNDKQIGQLVGFSPQWVRVQRLFRRRGQPHILSLDPVMVGSKPRYVADEVMAWVESLKANR